MKKSLGDYRNDYFNDSAKVSEISRSLGLAAIAIVWAFTKVTKEGDIRVSGWLQWALLFVILGLILDLFQYLFRTVAISIFYRFHEKRIDKLGSEAMKKSASEDVLYPKFLKSIAWVIFSLKIGCMILGYFFIYSFIIEKL